MRLALHTMFSLSAAIMVPETISISPVKTTGGQCFLLWEQHLVSDGRGTDKLKRRLAHGKGVALLIQALLGTDPSCLHAAYHTAGQIRQT